MSDGRNVRPMSKQCINEIKVIRLIGLFQSPICMEDGDVLPGAWTVALEECSKNRRQPGDPNVEPLFSSSITVFAGRRKSRCHRRGRPRPSAHATPTRMREVSPFAVGSRAWRVVLALVLAAASTGACRSQQQWTENDGGVTRWIDVPGGQLKTRVYMRSAAPEAPILVLVVHGDLPEPPPSYQYEFAKNIADTVENAATTGIVAAGVLRPGYYDPVGDRSSGDMGRAVADNYTPEVVDAVASAARALATDHDARAIVLVGHSGGAAIAANLLGRHPDVAHGAVLVGCGCDPAAWRATRLADTGNPVFRGETRSLQPLNLVDDVAPATVVRLVVGEDDDVAPPAYSQAYARALRERGIDASVEVVPGLGHNILFAPSVFEAVTDVLAMMASMAAPDER
jgi:predicted esterase